MAQGREHSVASQEEMLSSSFYLFRSESGASRNSYGTYFKSLSRHSRSIYRQRGIPAEVFLDNGFNFIGTQAELKKMYQLAQDRLSAALIQWASTKSIQWHFSPG